ncbi:MAG: PAS domain S-box protein [Methanoregula sp.]|jgi:PAS domain S-box-containing protein
MDEYQNEIGRIKEELENHPEGLSITDIASQLSINRNSVAKYMDILQVQGSVDGKKRGTSKVYSLSHRVPAASIKKVCNRPHILISHEGIVVEANPRFYSVTGLPAGQVLHQQFEKLPLIIRESANAQQILKAALRGVEQFVQADISNATATSTVTLSFLPVVFETGKPGVALILEDSPEFSPEHLQDDSRLLELRSLLDKQVEYVVQHTSDGIIRYVNESYCRATGRSREDLVGHQFKPLVSPDDAKRILAHRSRLSPQYPTGMIEFRAIMANGEARWQQWWDRAVYDDRGQVTGYYSFGLDNTDLVLANQKLKKTREMLEDTIVTRTNELREINRQLYEEMARREKMEQQFHRTQFAMDNAADMVFWVTRNARIDYANTAAVESLGYTEGELSGFLFSEIITVALPETWSDLWGRVKHEGTVTTKTSMIKKDGITVPVETVIRFMEYHGNEFACCFSRDISERTRMEFAIQHANKKLNVLTSLARHDIQNKITVLLGYLARIRKKETDPVILGYLDRQEQAASAIRDEIALTRDFKDLGNLPPAWLDLSEIIRRSTGQFALRPVTFTQDLPKVLLYADPQIERVFLRLFEYALSEGDEPVSVRISSRQENDSLVMIVEFYSRGIAPGEKEAIFELGTTGSFQGRLFIVREILSLTGIGIHETGEYGQFTRFEMDIPHASRKLF